MIEQSGLCTVVGEPEALGILGLSWRNKVAAAMGIKINILNAGKIESYIDKLHNAYLTGIQKQKISVLNPSALGAYMADVTKETREKIDSFIAELSRLAKAGEIPYSAYDPSKSAATGIFNFAKSLPDKIIIAGAVVLGAYLLVPRILSSLSKPNKAA